MSYYENALKMRPYIEKATVSLSDAEARRQKVGGEVLAQVW